MKNLVLYYSLSGNTEVVANEVSKLTGGELKKIELTNKSGKIGFAWAAVSSLLGLKASIKTPDVSLGDYDNIFLGGQVWAGHSSTPLNAILEKFDFSGKNIFVFLTLADEKAPLAAFQSIAGRVERKGGQVIDTLFVQTIMNRTLSPETVKSTVSDWIERNRVYII